jgi:hypothetical protein
MTTITQLDIGVFACDPGSHSMRNMGVDCLLPERMAGFLFCDPHSIMPTVCPAFCADGIRLLHLMEPVDLQIRVGLSGRAPRPRQCKAWRLLLVVDVRTCTMCDRTHVRARVSRVCGWIYARVRTCVCARVHRAMGRTFKLAAWAIRKAR